MNCGCETKRHMYHSIVENGFKFRLIFLIAFCVCATFGSQSQTNDDARRVNTYVNPVLPGDHPDPTLLKVGNDFYHCGSSFHFLPYMPIYHSTDLVHWEIISRVLPPSKATWVTDRPSAGTWQGAITYFYDSYWIYFSANGQWFSKASSPKGPWSDPVQVRTNPVTGPLGYDNSIFVDDDGKPYMVIKNGQKVNRIQALGRDGQLADTVINLDWINAKLQYSWAEGPVMCKRNGIYYYFPAGDVSGGQYVLKASALTSDSTKWERLGNFFRPITDSSTGFRSPNHITAPIQLADGTWWTLGQSYEKKNATDDWSGMGRQSSLYQVIWEGDRPWGIAPTSMPVKLPALPRSSIRWRAVDSDYFDVDSLQLQWHFLTKKAATQISFSDRKGWLRLTPDTSRAHIMQKETDHFYSMVTRVDFNAKDSVSKAGLYMTNGNQRENIRFYIGIEDGKKKIILASGTEKRSIANTFGSVMLLKLQRVEHTVQGYVSIDGTNWTEVGKPISTISIDKAQPNFNSWVGTSIGLFAEGVPAHFDYFICKDGYSKMEVSGYSNYNGIESVRDAHAVTNTLANAGWLMISGVDLSRNKAGASIVELGCNATEKGEVEIWQDGLEDGGQLLASILIQTGKQQVVKRAIKRTSGVHDIYLRFTQAAPGAIHISSIQFKKN